VSLCSPLARFLSCMLSAECCFLCSASHSAKDYDWAPWLVLMEFPEQKFRRRILIVDDDEITRYTLGALLSKEGYEVLTAGDGFEALAAMRCGIPDLIITDLKMPNMSGFELLGIVRKRFPSIAVIAMSAEFMPNSFPMDILVDRYLRKGDTPPLEIVESVRELLEASPLRAQPARPEFAPVWIPRSQTGYVVLTFTDCLRSFSVPQRKLEERQRCEESCVHCGMKVQYCLDTISVAEPPAAATSLRDEMRKQLESSRRTIAESHQLIDDVKRRIS